MKNLTLIFSAALLISACGKVETGPMGPSGPPGSSCSVDQLSNGAQITCENGTSAVLSNGVDGQDATLPAGYSYIPEGAFYIVAIEDLCGAGAQQVLFRLSDNSLLAHYSHGAKQYLTVLSPGSYTSTDGYNCRFDVGPAPGYVISY
jgi:hypothetical protein